jgi:hypothetical protein
VFLTHLLDVTPSLIFAHAPAAIAHITPATDWNRNVTASRCTWRAAIPAEGS